MSQKIYLAIDLGAESGRVMAGLWNGRVMKLEEVHRFPNGPVALAGTLRWDTLRLWQEIQNGLALAGKKFGKQVVSVGANTWGVDFVLLNKQEEVLGLPYHYRDIRTHGLMDQAFKKVSREKIFARTGLQFMELNSLYQLLAWRDQAPALLAAADKLLFTPDFLHWAMCGAKKAEFTIASTSQFVDAKNRNWSRPLLKKLGLPTHFLPEIVPAGTMLGPLRKALGEQTGLSNASVIAPASHDTASAVVGVPTLDTGRGNWAFLSSGTWSLMGVETQQANLSPEALAINMSNEGGADGTYRLLKNIMGLWLVQRCKRAFEARGQQYDYGRLAKLAAAARPMRSLVNPNDPRFLNPPDMPAAIQDFCRETKQLVPNSVGELARCAYESLALKYQEVLGGLERLTGTAIRQIHIVGGGSQNAVLNQLTADACERPVTAGPVEATALGNLLVQAKAEGELKNLGEIREVVRASSVVKHYKPGRKWDWRGAGERFAELRKHG